MAIGPTQSQEDTSSAAQSSAATVRGRRLSVGVVVLVSVILAGLLTALLQFVVFQVNPGKLDLTSNRINSLGPGTREVLDHLGDETIRLTSLYFETDLEHDAQKRYRQAVDNLLRLYQLENPSKVETAWVNPLQDQAALSTVLERLRALPSFEQESRGHAEVIEQFRTRIQPEFKAAMQGFLSELNKLDQSASLSGPSLTAPVERAVQSWVILGDRVVEELALAQQTTLPQHAAGVRKIKEFFVHIGEKAQSFSTWTDRALSTEEYPENIKNVLTRMRVSVTEWSTRFEAQQLQLEGLPALELDSLQSKIQSKNVVLVESSKSAKAVSFEDLWPAVVPNSVVADNEFDKRRFAGEGVVTPAILQLLQEKKTAVVFVRFAGPKLFGMSGFGAGASIGPMSGLKEDLERLNYIVREWDLSQGLEPPSFSTVPGRVIYVVMRPQPKQGMPGTQGSSSLGQAERAVLLQAIHDSGRAVFVVGWDLNSPAYDYSEYLRTKWGIDAQGKSLVVSASPSRPGEWQLHPRDFPMLRKVKFTESPVTTGLESQPMVLPFATPLALVEETPEGVSIEELAYVADTDDIWAVKDYRAFAMRYDESRNDQGLPYTRKERDDISGPFPVMVACEKDDTTIVVLGTRGEFFIDAVIGKVAQLDLAQGRIVSRRPSAGNFALLTNVLHYLDDTLQWINVGSPMDTTRLRMTTVQLAAWRVIVVGLWPALAMFCGFVAWLMRRR